MKPNAFLLVIAALLALLAGYSAFSIARGDEYDWLAFMVTTICAAAGLIPMMGFTMEPSRLSVSVKLLATIGLVVMMAINLAYVIAGIGMPSYLIVNAVVLLIYLSAIYRLMMVKDV